MELSLKEVCTKLGVASNYIANYVSRGQLVKNANGHFDINNEINSLFFQKRGIALGVIEETEELKELKQLQAEKRAKSKELDEVSSGGSLSQIEKAYKTLQVHKAKKDVELLDIKLSKAKALVIPTEMVGMVLAQQFKSATMAFKNGAEKFLTRIAHEYELNNEQSTKARHELIKIINEAIDDAIDDSKKQIVNIVEDFQEQRGRGERK